MGLLAYLHAIDRILTTTESLPSSLLWILWFLAAACNFSYASVALDSTTVKLDYSLHLTMCSTCALLNIWQSCRQRRRRVVTPNLYDVNPHDNSNDRIVS